MEKTPKELYKERVERIEKATRLEEPDRVPITPMVHFFGARYAGITCYEALFDYEKSFDALIKTVVDFNWDSIFMPSIPMGAFSGLGFIEEAPDIAVPLFMCTGPIQDIMGYRVLRLPGRELPEDVPFQFIGQEFMKVEEYDKLIENPCKFMNEVIFPRTCRSLEKPELTKVMITFLKLGQEIAKYLSVAMRSSAKLQELGYPILCGGITMNPLDLIADMFRDFKNVMLDIYRVPDKVKKACEGLLPLLLKMGIVSGKMGLQLYKTPGVFIPLHLNEYLSPKLYGEFYWPTLRDLQTELVKEGLIPTVFYEGYHDAHLERLKELPKGKTIAFFEKTDLRKAKELVGDHVCIMGGLPASVLVGGTPNKVEEYTKRLLEDLKPGGGFIFSGSGVAGIPDQAKPENVKAMVEAVMKYGQY